MIQTSLTKRLEKNLFACQEQFEAAAGESNRRNALSTNAEENFKAHGRTFEIRSDIRAGIFRNICPIFQYAHEI